jgi:hypothetical protein
VSQGATVSVYAVGSSCSEAKRVLGGHGAEAGKVRVRVVCVSDGEGSKSWTLAAVGANARRASQDSTTVAYLADPDPTAAEYSRSILEEAGIALLSGESGAAEMHQLLKALEEAGNASNLRESVNKSLSSG